MQHFRNSNFYSKKSDFTMGQNTKTDFFYNEFHYLV